jgi:hypothetical protein
MDDVSVFERFLALAKRELACADVLLLGPDEAPPDAPNAVVARLRDGRHVVASFESEPKDKDALQRRLAILADTFSDALATPPSERTRARPPVVTSLHEELKALAARARARDVVVIDVDSPVIWGCASVRRTPRARADVVLRDVSKRELAPSEVAPDESGPLQDVALPVPLESSRMASEILEDEPEEIEPEATRRAIESIRSLPALELDMLHKGRHLRHVERDAAFYLALSFSGIYLLVLVFDETFDELRAERAAHESLPRIERLVLALPPLDPDPAPMGDVVALRRPRRR